MTVLMDELNEWQLSKGETTKETDVSLKNEAKRIREAALEGMTTASAGWLCCTIHLPIFTFMSCYVSICVTVCLSTLLFVCTVICPHCYLSTLFVSHILKLSESVSVWGVVLFCNNT